jgi:hypothetical protein
MCAGSGDNERHRHENTQRREDRTRGGGGGRSGDCSYPIRRRVLKELKHTQQLSKPRLSIAHFHTETTTKSQLHSVKRVYVIAAENAPRKREKRRGGERRRNTDSEYERGERG